MRIIATTPQVAITLHQYQSLELVADHMALGASRTPGPVISTIPFHLVVVQILAIDVAQHRKHGLAYAARTAFQISGAVLPLTRRLASSN
jgi:uncharacterized membrane protein